MSEPPHRRTKAASGREADAADRAFPSAIRRQERGRRKRDEYPEFVFDDREGDQRFVRVVRSILSQFDFENPRMCAEPQRRYYQALRKQGAAAVQDALWKAHEGSGRAQLLMDGQATHLGQHVIQSLKPFEKKKFLPYNDVLIVPVEHVLLVQFSSLVHENQSRVVAGHRQDWTFWHSRRRPTLAVEASPCVAFTRHAIEQLCHRLVPASEQYLGLGDAHAYLADCLYFEPQTIKNDRTGLDQHAFCLYQSCFLELFHPEILMPPIEMWARLTHSSQPEKPWYFRVGYCPYEIVNGFAVAPTLLLPGFRKTPEYAALRDSDLPAATRQEWLRRAKAEKFHDILDPVDEQMIGWFHRNVAPQVVQLEGEVFASPLRHQSATRESSIHDT